MESSKRNQVVLSFGKDEDEIQISLRRQLKISDSPDEGDDLVMFTLKSSDLRSVSPKQAILTLGARVLAAFVHLDEQELGHLGYKAISDAGDILADKELMERVAKGDPEALYECALDKIFESIHKRDINCLQIAETYLKRASEKGFERATDFLERVWPIEKEERRRIILDGRQT